MTAAEKKQTIPQIREIMPRITEELGAIPKRGRNAAQNYRFRKVDDLIDALAPILRKHGVILQTRVTQHWTDSRKERKAGPNAGQRTINRATLTLSVEFIAPDGSSVVKEAAGEGIDFGGDKATAKAMSAAFKYALGLGLPIPFVELEDGDQDGAGQQVPARPGVSTERLSDKCRPEVAEEIKTLARKLDLEVSDLKKAVVRRNAQTVADLSVDQADDLLGKLRVKAAQQADIPF